MIRGKFNRFVLPAFLSLLFATSLPAQQSTGALNGVVMDATGALIPNAAMTVSNDATGVTRAVSTNGSGIYILNNLPVGNYTLTATKPGFKTVKRTGIILGVNETLTVNMEMPTGSVNATVEVLATAAQLEASTAELGTVISKQVTEDLPLNGREFTQLLLLTPGASRLNTSQNTSGREPSAPGSVFLPAMHGQGNRSNYFMLDGINDNEDLFSTFAVSPTADDIQEFKVQSHNDQAQYGGVLGGIINVVTKSGTNKIHGAAWEFNRNNALGAANPITQVKLPLNQNQFGGNIGGPVVIPHLYHGQDKTFFFGSYEGFRKNTSAASSISTAITQNELAGNFSGSTSFQLFNPYTTTPAGTGYTRAAYTDNIITTPLNPVMVAYAKLLLPIVPDSAGEVNNYINNTPQSYTQNNFSGRIDEVLNPHNSFWFRYSTINQTSTVTSGSPTNLNVTAIDATNYGVNYLHIFSDTLTLDVQFGHNIDSDNSNVRYTTGSSDSILSQVAFNPAFACGYAAYGANENCLVPTVSISGYAGGGESTSDAIPSSSIYQYDADVSKLKGHHFIQAGAIFMRDDYNQQAVGATVGFASTGTAYPQTYTVGGNPVATGNALASFLLGVVDNSKDRVTVVPIHGQKLAGGYVQDQWKVLPHLTINAGLRYDVMFWPRYGNSKNGTDAIGEINFANGTYALQTAVGDCATLNVAPCIPGGLASQANVYVSPNGHLWRTNYDNIQPRVGFAYQVAPNDVIRGGFGIFFDEWSGAKQTVQGIGGDWPSVTQPSATNQDPLTANPTADPTNPLSGTTSLPAANPFAQSNYYRDPNAQNPESEQYNLGIQHLFNSHITLEVDYVGSNSFRLPVGGNLYNVATTPGAGSSAVVASRRPYPNITPTHYDQSIGYGNYNALETRLTQMPVHGLQYIISYTWSKTMDLACDGLFGAEGCSEPDPYHLQSDYSVAGYNLPNNLEASVTYELPIGRGRLVNLDSRALDIVAGGWQVNTIYAFTSGTPYNLTTTGDIANTGNTNADRANKIGNPALAHPTRAEWFNTAAFAIPASYTFGTEGRNDLRGDGFQNVDISLFKNIQLTDKDKLQFRLEAFNALNHLTYGNPAANVSTPSTLGTVTSERSTEREVQVAVKFLF